MKDKMYASMGVIGLLLLIGTIIIYIFFFWENGNKEILKFGNVEFVNSNIIENKNNNKRILLDGKFNSIAMDSDFNVSVKGVGIKRIVRKWNGKNWDLVDENSSDLYHTTSFRTNEIKVGEYILPSNFLDNYILDYDVYNDDLDISSIKIPEGFTFQDDDTTLLQYEEGTYFNLIGKTGYITNSKDIKNPEIGDIRIYFKALFPSGLRYVVLLGKQDGNKINEYESEKVELASSNNESAYLAISEKLNIMIMKLILIAMSIMSFISCLLLFYGFSKFDIIEKKFGKIQGYKIFLLSLTFGIIISLVFYLIM
ncbi:MAG: hypothetical protein IJ068_06940 [Bacilli bacterium]|nr:hypothetical protein [Bacilli bacterium]